MYKFFLTQSNKQFLKHAKQTFLIVILALVSYMATAQDATLTAGGDATGTGGGRLHILSLRALPN